MRSHELESNEERRERLRKSILAGEKPIVIYAEYSKGNFSTGDLERMGWGKYYREHEGDSNFRVWWEYLGPNSIMLNGNEMKKGDAADPYWIDYS